MISSLKDYRIIITGACGVIGQALSNRLVSEGATVLGFARRESRKVSCPLVIGDLLDKSFLTKAFKDLPPSNLETVVFHLAGLSDANICDADPLLAFEMNTVMTLNILDAMVKNNIHRLIYPSSAYVYGTDYQKDIKEDFSVVPPNAYAMTKVTSENMIKTCCDYGKLDCDVLRIANIYGPQLNLKTVIGTLVAQSEKGGKIVLQNLTPIRDFIYIDDAVEAMVRLIGSKQKGYSVYNLSLGKGFSVGEMANIFCQVKGISLYMIQSAPPSDQKGSRLVLDNQALGERLYWKPQIDLKEGLRRTLAIRDEIKRNEKT